MSTTVFVSHASEDKADVARPLAEELQRRGIDVWFDEYDISTGDSLLKKIDQGLLSCQYGVVVVSHSFLSKTWAQVELDALVTKETLLGKKTVLPVWHRIGIREVAQYSPVLASKVGVSTQKGIPYVANRIVQAVESAGLAKRQGDKAYPLLSGFYDHDEIMRIIDISSDIELRPHLISQLIDSLPNCPDPTERHWIYIGLGALGGDMAEMAIQEGLTDDDDFARSGAEEGLRLLREVAEGSEEQDRQKVIDGVYRKDREPGASE